PYSSCIIPADLHLETHSNCRADVAAGFANGNDFAVFPRGRKLPQNHERPDRIQHVVFRNPNCRDDAAAQPKDKRGEAH
ncbi:MAG: hypothetical protein Q4G06_13250, partial [Clostridia bacterium]|nr:hypothetical protein [Clostridia bacterium]